MYSTNEIEVQCGITKPFHGVYEFIIQNMCQTGHDD